MTRQPPVPYASIRPLLWLVAAAIFMQMLDSTIVNTALPSMAMSLGESPLRMQSVVIAYALSVAMFIPASGWIADRFGTRRTFLAAVLLFTLGSLCCAWSSTLRELVMSRVLQGIGGAMLVPVGRLAVMRTVDRGDFLRAMSFVTVPALLGPLIGPALGGWLVAVTSWHWIFLINLPIGIVAMIATLPLMPDHYGDERTPFDFAGFALLSIGMVCLSLALDAAAEPGIRRALVSMLLVVGLGGLVCYWLRAARVASPLFPLALFGVDSFRVGILGNLFARIGSSSMPFLIPLLLQVALGHSALHAGLMMIPVAVAAMLVKRAVVPLIGRFGYRRVLVINTVVLGLLMASFALIEAQQPTWLRIVQFAVFGAVNSLQFTVMNALTLRDLPGSMASPGNSLLSMMMMVATGFAVAAAGSLIGTFKDALGLSSIGAALPAFQLTFACMGLLTMLSAAIFRQLATEPVPRPLSADEDHQ